MRRILSLWLPTFATDRIARGLTPPLAAGTPLVTRLSDRGRLTVAAVNAAARAKRLVPGMGLADARALEPQVHVVDADPEGDVAALGRLADWARRYTPWTAVDPADPPGFGPKGLGGGPGLLLDITGCAHLLGGEHELLLDLERRLAKAGVEGRAAIADSIGAAWAQARFGAQLVVPPGGAAEALADLPLPALRLGPDLVASLRRVGLRRVGELMRMAQGTGGGQGSKNRAALAARYGAQVALRLDQALGWVEEPLSPRRAPTRHTARLTVVDPLSTPEGLAQAVRHLLGRVAASLTAAGEGARSLELEAWRIDAGHDTPPQVLTVGASRPNRDPAHLWRLLEPRMDQLEPGAGFETMAVSVTHAAPFDGGQAVLSAEGLADLAGPPVTGPEKGETRLAATPWWPIRPSRNWWTGWAPAWGLAGCCACCPGRAGYRNRRCGRCRPRRRTTARPRPRRRLGRSPGRPTGRVPSACCPGRRRWRWWPPSPTTRPCCSAGATRPIAWAGPRGRSACCRNGGRGASAARTRTPSPATITGWRMARAGASGCIAWASTTPAARHPAGSCTAFSGDACPTP
ncbi:DNA polymerase Y family protein [Nitrospirillum sp. BR 11828]|uniref:Y-family DNA polymerase n=1 Tax=Nitrospirillum sp. BR 11828 TaxID=3104325 RepID=UPI002AC9F2F8|nr:DNA polymerase Y family protein [Nitrospirillum sp. BR 11828]MDZ5648086.1 DNA polymerase Y family protein [Nitrospirillum sp. BR 11828]